MTKSKIVPQIDRIKSAAPEISRARSTQNIDVAKLVDLREKLLVMVEILDQLHQNCEEKAKSLIKKHRGHKCLFALKKLKLYEMLLQDIEKQTNLLENSIIGRNMTYGDVKNTECDSEALLSELDEVTRLEEPLRQGETFKDRETKLKQIFKVREIEDVLVFPLFAQYEAEANDITLTTSGTFTRSEVKTQPSSTDSLDN